MTTYCFQLLFSFNCYFALHIPGTPVIHLCWTYPTLQRKCHHFDEMFATAEPGVVILITSCAASDENFVKIIFPFPCFFAYIYCLFLLCWIFFFIIFYCVSLDFQYYKYFCFPLLPRRLSNLKRYDDLNYNIATFGYHETSCRILKGPSEYLSYHTIIRLTTSTHWGPVYT